MPVGTFRSAVADRMAKRTELGAGDVGSALDPSLVHGVEYSQVTLFGNADSDSTRWIGHKGLLENIEVRGFRSNPQPYRGVGCSEIADSSSSAPERIDHVAGRLHLPDVDDVGFPRGDPYTRTDLDGNPAEVLRMRRLRGAAFMPDHIARPEWLMARGGIGVDHRRRKSLQPFQLGTIGNPAPIAGPVCSHDRCEEACGSGRPFAAGQAAGVGGSVWISAESPMQQLNFDREH